MSKPYLIENDGAGFKWLALQVDDFIDLMPEGYSDAQLLRFSYHNTSLKDGWENIQSEFIQAEAGEPLPVPDISLWLPGAALVLSAKALSVLGSLIGEFGEILPVDCVGDRVFIFNCRNVVDADPAQSESLIHSGMVVGVRQIGFRQGDVAKSAVFKTRFDNCTGLYANDLFKTAVEKNGLRGVKFTPDLLPDIEA
ncbi:MAG: hypothetical protein NVV73_14830 [Cellvibrionaceae bacterium]|nr:hypothetical protein [Cellvibrionaceae bacterium]